MPCGMLDDHGVGVLQHFPMPIDPGVALRSERSAQMRLGIRPVSQRLLGETHLSQCQRTVRLIESVLEFQQRSSVVACFTQGNPMSNLLGHGIGALGAR
jgi:hypothetical protein